MYGSRLTAYKKLLLLIFFTITVVQLHAKEFYVSPKGKISTLPAARDAVRALRASGEMGNIDVAIENGTYVLDETLIFGLKDSAPAGAVTRYRATTGVRLDLFCQNITVENSSFRNLGGTGILLAGYGPGKKDVNKNNTIQNNELTKVGSIFLHSPGIFIW